MMPVKEQIGILINKMFAVCSHKSSKIIKKYKYAY